MDDLHTTLDYSTLLTHIHSGPSPKLPKSATTHFRLDITDKPLFYSTLEATITYAQALANEVTLYSNESQTRVLLDHLARSITSTIDIALSASTKKTTERGTGHSWWDDACQQAVRKYRQVCTESRYLHHASIVAQPCLEHLSALKAQLRCTVR